VENLTRVTKWTDRIHEFQLVVGRERKRYTLLRKESWPSSMREMELRVGSRRRLKVAESAWRGGQDPCSIGCEKGKFIYKKERGG
jgi:hypothetical protein